jgi:hypothetical protein
MTQLPGVRTNRFGDPIVPVRRTVNRFGDPLSPTPSAEPQNLRQFVGEETAATLTPETAIAGGHVDDFVSFLRAKADKLEPGSSERQQLADRISGLQRDVAEYRTQQHEAKRLGVSRDTANRLASPAGAFEQSLAQSAVGQTALRAEQGLSNIAETGISLASRAFGSGRMSATLHRDKAARDQFLDAAEKGGQIENTLGERGSRIFNSVVSSVSKMAAASTVAGPTAVYSLIAGESYDDALHEAEQAGMTGGKAQSYAVVKGAVETGLTVLMGKIGKRLGVSSLEESLSPGMRRAAQQLASEAAGKSGLSKLAGEAAGVGLEAGEELLVDAVQQGVELTAGTSKRFDWERLLDATAAGAVGRGATGLGALKDALRKVPSQKIEETVKGVTAAEAAIEASKRQLLASPEDRAAFERIAAQQVQVEGQAGARGLNNALTFIQNATPDMLAKAAEPLNQREFAKLTGLKKTSELFRAAFRDTLRLYSEIDRSAVSSQNETPTTAAVASEQAPVTSDPSAAGAPVAAPTDSVDTKTAAAEPTTSARRADVDRDRELLGLPEIPNAESRPWATALDTAKTNRVPDRAMSIARELLTAPRGLSDVETAGLVVKAAELKNGYADLQKRIESSTDEAERTTLAAEQDRVQDEFDTLTDALRTSGTEKGRALAAQKLTINQAFDLVSVQSRAKAKKGEPLTPQQRRTLDRLVNQLDDIQAQITGHKGTPDELAALELKRDKLKQEIKYKINDLKPKTLWQRASGPFHFSRTLRASMDFSAVLRQGGFITFSRPTLAVKALGPMIQAARSELAAKKLNDQIAARPNAKLYQAAKLYLHNENADVGQREEAYVSRWLSTAPNERLSELPLYRIPDAILRHGVAGSQRAYTTFLNQLRADTFDTLAATLAKNGEPTLTELRAIANYVNVATGRGGLGKYDRALGDMSSIFFAPRYVVSRFQLIAAQPLVQGHKASERVRGMIAEEYARYAIGMATFYALSNAAFGDDEGFSLTFDPRSSEFGKLNFNGTRVDPLAGLAQATTFLARMFSGQTVSPKGKVSDIRGPKARVGNTSYDVAARFLRTKLAPLPGMIADVAAGSNVVGEPVTPEQLAADSVTPLSFKDIAEAIEQQGIPRGAAMGMAAMLGMGLQSYKSH